MYSSGNTYCDTFRNCAFATDTVHESDWARMLNCNLNIMSGLSHSAYRNVDGLASRTHGGANYTEFRGNSPEARVFYAVYRSKAVHKLQRAPSRSRATQSTSSERLFPTYETIKIKLKKIPKSQQPGAQACAALTPHVPDTCTQGAFQGLQKRGNHRSDSCYSASWVKRGVTIFKSPRRGKGLLGITG
jgi:hypothetical protein